MRVEMRIQRPWIRAFPLFLVREGKDFVCDGLAVVFIGTAEMHHRVERLERRFAEGHTLVQNLAAGAPTPRLDGFLGAGSGGGKAAQRGDE